MLYVYAYLYTYVSMCMRMYILYICIYIRFFILKFLIYEQNTEEFLNLTQIYNLSKGCCDKHNIRSQVYVWRHV